MTDRPRTRTPGGFTLIELLVVVAIVILVSAVTLPTILPALSNRQVSEGARIFQAALAGARDRAVRSGNPSGIRLIPDQVLSDLARPLPAGGRLTASRIIPIEQAPDITDGFATIPSTNLSPFFTVSWSNAGGNPPLFPIQLPPPAPPAYYPPGVLIVMKATFRNNDPSAGPNPPTNWFYNVRLGDRFRFNDSGNYYTVVGPLTNANDENFVNDGAPGVSSLVVTYQPNPPKTTTTTTDSPEYLFLVNGVDDDRDGYIDNGFDGLDQNLNGVVDDMGSPNNGIPSEWTEVETFQGSQLNAAAQALPPAMPYAIVRRPAPLPGGQEVSLPSAVVVDMTTWNTTHERSRVPVDPNSGFVDILLNPSGQVVASTAYSSPSSASMAASFYHFWIADRVDVYSAVSTTNPQLPIALPPNGVVNAAAGNRYLQKDRQLVTLFTRTGQVVTNSVENFDFAHAYDVPPYSTTNLPYDPSLPFSDAQLGIREAK